MTETDALLEQDDTQGHRFGGEVGEAPVEGGRRPMATGDEDDVAGHALRPRMDDADDTEGHALRPRIDGEDEDDTEGHKQKR